MDWALKIIILTRQFPVEPALNSIRNQVVRSGPSAAANYRAACRAKSNADFINKLKITEEELDESMFWIELVAKLAPELRPQLSEIYKEANELLAITVASIKTMRETSPGKGKRR